ncbi:hypothetical protein niasHT_022901 [Heterodera trifolii]|uniref:Cyclic nucleotide-binding domain-containing protein n=1 Tax=Heterodera trifolii TaxID=157864 RepID=A0ABD2KBN3_9BILA
MRDSESEGSGNYSSLNTKEKQTNVAKTETYKQKAESKELRLAEEHGKSKSNLQVPQIKADQSQFEQDHQHLNPDQSKIEQDKPQLKPDQPSPSATPCTNRHLTVQSGKSSGWSRLSARVEEAVIKNLQQRSDHEQLNATIVMNGMSSRMNADIAKQNPRMKFSTIAKGLSLMSKVRVADVALEREQLAFFTKFGISTSDSVQQEKSCDLSNATKVFAWDGLSKWEFFRDKFVLEPSRDYYYRWLGIVTLAYCYNLLLIVYRCVFIDSQSVSFACLMVFIFLDIIFDIIYVIDSFVRARTGYMDQGLMVRDVTKIKRRYKKDNMRWIDLISCLPFDYVFELAFKTTNPCFRFNRLIRIDRPLAFQNATEMRMSRPNIFRLLCVFLYILVLIHWNACFYFLVSYLIGFGSTSWVYGYANIQSLPPGTLDTLGRRYLYSFYWSTLMLAAIGEVPWPIKSVEFAIVCADLLFGVLVFATTVGNVGTLITNAGSARLDFQTNIDKVKSFMKHRSVGKKLVHRIGKWFDYLWENKQAMGGRDDQEVLKLLPTKLQAEIAMHVHFETLRKVRLFQDCESGLLGELVLKLELQVFSPKDYVCRKGDVGREMYIVKKGRLQVVADDGVKIFHTLVEGAVFGELSLLNIPGSKHGNRRSASIRSVGYTDLFVLKKADLWAALREYPEAKKLLMQKGCELLLKDGLLDENLAQNLHDESKSEEKQLCNLRTHVEKLQNRLARLTAEYISSEARLFERLEYLEDQLAKKGIKHGK